jgi:hypothetical protein
MTTRTDLGNAVNEYAIRDDLNSGETFTNILRLAESRIARDIRTVQQEASTDLVFTGRSANLPDDFLEIRDPFIADQTRDIDYLTPKQFRQNTAYENGRVAAFYTVFGDKDSESIQMQIAGPASAASPVTMTVNYWTRFAALVEADDTNWLLDNHFDVYLWACSWAGAVKAQDFELADKYESYYNVCAGDMSIHENRKRYGAVPKTPRTFPRTIV